MRGVRASSELGGASPLQAYGLLAGLVHHLHNEYRPINANPAREHFLVKVTPFNEGIG